MELTTQGSHGADHHRAPGAERNQRRSKNSEILTLSGISHPISPEMTQGLDVMLTSLCRASVDLDSLILSITCSSEGYRAPFEMLKKSSKWEKSLCPAQ